MEKKSTTVNQNQKKMRKRLCKTQKKNLINASYQVIGVPIVSV